MPSIVTRVDLPGKRLYVRPPAGLLELGYEEKERTAAVRGFLPERSAVLGAADRRELERQTVLLFP